MVSAGEQVGTKCSILFTHITGLWLYESHSWCLGHWAPISLLMTKTVYMFGERKALLSGAKMCLERGMFNENEDKNDSRISEYGI